MTSAEPPTKVTRVTRSQKSPTGRKIKKAFEEPGAIEGRGVVYVKHVPHGFYEEEMRNYFKQFGTVTRLRLSRSKKTGRSKGYAYVEFESEDVAKIAADSMSDYLMFRQRLMCKVIDPETLHPSTFKGSLRKFSQPKSAAIARERHNRPIPASQQAAKASKLRKKNSKKIAAFKELGIEYSMEITDEKPVVEPMAEDSLVPAAVAKTSVSGITVAPKAAKRTAAVALKTASASKRAVKSVKKSKK